MQRKIGMIGILLLIVAVISLSLNPLTLAADATDDLLVKQSKLVEKWGVKTANDVVSKGGRDAERIGNLNKLLDELPISSVNKFDDGVAFDMLSRKDITSTIDAMKSVKNVAGYEKVTGAMVSQRSWWGHASQLKKANELKKSGKNLVEFERPLKNAAGNEFPADLVYKDTGSNIEKFAEIKNRDWSSLNGNIRQGEIDELGDQLKKYHDAIGDWDRIRLFSEKPLPLDFIIELEKRFGKNAVNKLLGG